MGKEEAEIRRIAIRCGFRTKKKEGGRQEVEIVGDGDDVPARCLTHQNFVLQFLATDDARAESSQVQREWRELHCLSPPSAAGSHSHGRSCKQKASPCDAQRGNVCGR